MRTWLGSPATPSSSVSRTERRLSSACISMKSITTRPPTFRNRSCRGISRAASMLVANAVSSSERPERNVPELTSTGVIASVASMTTCPPEGSATRLRSKLRRSSSRPNRSNSGLSCAWNSTRSASAGSVCRACSRNRSCAAGSFTWMADTSAVAMSRMARVSSGSSSCTRRPGFDERLRRAMSLQLRCSRRMSAASPSLAMPAARVRTI